MPDQGRTPRGRDRDREREGARPRVKHSMRKSPYLVSLVFLLTATALTLLNIYVSSPPRHPLTTRSPT